MNASFITKQEIVQNATVNYWFNVEGEDFALSDCDGELRLLDCDGCPVEDCNDHDNVKQLLIDQDPCNFS